MINSFITQYQTNFKSLSFRYVPVYPFATNVYYNWVGFRELQRNEWMEFHQKINLIVISFWQWGLDKRQLNEKKGWTKINSSKWKTSCGSQWGL